MTTGRCSLRLVGLWGLVGALGAGVLCVLYFFAPDQSAFYPRCLLNAATGLQCPGCGGLRATHQLLHGNLEAAFALNPLLVLAAPLLVVAGTWKWVRRDRVDAEIPRPRRGHRDWWIWVLVGALLLFGIGRNLL